MSLASARMSASLRDVLGDPWLARVVAVRPSRRARGADRAVLVHQAGHATRDGGRPLERAALYLPGFVDTFFQAAHAQAWIDAGIEFYGLDCRAQGRAGLHLPALDRIYDLRLREEEIALTIRFLRELGHRHITLIGHSTGGLQAAIYAGVHPPGLLDDSGPDVVVLNSPWFDLVDREPVRTLGTFVAHGLRRIAPAITLRTLTDFYPRWLHVDYGGEWEFDTRLKPVTPVPVQAGFVSSVRDMQSQLARGLDARQPVFLACSTRFGTPTSRESPELENSDVILDPADMVRLAPKIGSGVTVRQFEGGIHDLACSRPPVRDQYTRAVIAFAQNN
ncbi:MAG TPA: alpha/beta hydrolase [Actinomycetaceae bacterium]|nr:alpha/beta hydrolase [Actinomycetaceae bacterium]